MHGVRVMYMYEEGVIMHDVAINAISSTEFSHLRIVSLMIMMGPQCMVPRKNGHTFGLGYYTCTISFTALHVLH